MEKKIKSFQSATAAEIKEYIKSYRTQVSHCWKVGDTRVESNGATYVIVDIGEKITIMRTDLVSVDYRMGTSGRNEYLDSDVDLYLSKQYSRILGDTFSDLVICRALSDPDYPRQLWLPSASEVFGNEAFEMDGKQFSYFKNRENRRLGTSWWTRSGFWYLSSSYTRFVTCTSDGSRGCGFPTSRHGLAPCFYV